MYGLGSHNKHSGEVISTETGTDLRWEETADGEKVLIING